MPILSTAEWYAVMQRQGVPVPLDHIMLATTGAEGGYNTTPIPGDNGQSFGPYQMYLQGAGAGHSRAEMEDPDWATAYMLSHEFAAAYQEALTRDLSEEDTAVYTYMRAERPYGWGGYRDPGLHSVAGEGFRHHYRAVAAAVAALRGDPQKPPEEKPEDPVAALAAEREWGTTILAEELKYADILRDARQKRQWSPVQEVENTLRRNATGEG